MVSQATLLSGLSPLFLSVSFYSSPIWQLNKLWDCVTHVLRVRFILSYFSQSFRYLKPRVDQYHILIRIPSQPLESAMIWEPGQLLSPLLKFGGWIVKTVLYSVLQGRVRQASHQTQHLPQSGRPGRYSRARLFCPSPTWCVATAAPDNSRGMWLWSPWHREATAFISHQACIPLGHAGPVWPSQSRGLPHCWWSRSHSPFSWPLLFSRKWCWKNQKSLSAVPRQPRAGINP